MNCIDAATPAARLMKLDKAQTEQAIHMALSVHIAMRRVRSASLSDRKGCSAASAARNAIFAATLACHGMAGPSPVFEGEMGFCKQVTGALELDVGSFCSRENRQFAILRSRNKTFPANGELHTAVWAAMDLGSRIPDIDAIAAVRVETSACAGRHAREVAIPDARTGGPQLALQRGTGAAGEAVSQAPREPGDRHAGVGRGLQQQRIGGPGSLEAPIDDADFERKFRPMAAPHIGAVVQERVLEFVSGLANQTDFRPLFDARSRQLASDAAREQA